MGQRAIQAPPPHRQPTATPAGANAPPQIQSRCSLGTLFYPGNARVQRRSPSSLSLALAVTPPMGHGPPRKTLLVDNWSPLLDDHLVSIVSSGLAMRCN